MKDVDTCVSAVIQVFWVQLSSHNQLAVIAVSVGLKTCSAVLFWSACALLGAQWEIQSSLCQGFSCAA